LTESARGRCVVDYAKYLALLAAVVSVTAPQRSPGITPWTTSANITQINDGTNPQTYSYVDNLYFLKQGDGPWGTRSWTYDRIGNRLTEIRGATTDTYNYTSHNPRLGSITLGGAAGTRAYTYDPAGNDIREASPTSQLDLHYDGANRLTQLLEETSRSASYMTYDGRNFLTQARQDVNACSPVVTQSVYTRPSCSKPFSPGVRASKTGPPWSSRKTPNSRPGASPGLRWRERKAWSRRTPPALRPAIWLFSRRGSRCTWALSYSLKSVADLKVRSSARRQAAQLLPKAPNQRAGHDPSRASPVALKPLLFRHLAPLSAVRNRVAPALLSLGAP